MTIPPMAGPSVPDGDAPRCALFMESPAPQLLLDADGRLLSANHAFRAMAGREQENLSGHALPELLEGWTWPVGRDGGPPAGWQSSGCGLRRPDGRTVPCDVTGRPFRLPDGTHRVLAFVHDTSAQAEAAHRLREQGELLTRVFDGAPLGMLAAFEDGRVLKANGALRRLLGVDLRDVSAPDGAPSLHGGARRIAAEWRALLGEAAKSLTLRGEWRAERTLSVLDGLPRVCALRATLVDPAEPALGLVVTVHDITLLRELERRRLEEAREQRDALVREVNHRIKNNLQGVAALMQRSARRQPMLARELDEAAARIEALAEVHGLRVRGGEAVPLAPLLGSIVANVRYMRATRVDLLERPEPGWWLPEQEAVPIALVLNELLTNALKHALPGTAPRVELAPLDDGLVVRVRNAGRLGAPVDLESERRRSTGLGLVATLLPRQGAVLRIREEDGMVTAELRLHPPALQ